MTVETTDLLDRLIAIRKWRGLTVHKVAKLIHLAPHSLYEIEARRRGCRLEILNAYALAVGAELGAWPVPIPEPPEVKRPPAFTAPSCTPSHETGIPPDNRSLAATAALSLATQTATEVDRVR